VYNDPHTCEDFHPSLFKTKLEHRKEPWKDRHIQRQSTLSTSSLILPTP
jgi:hypothetical protein